MRPYNPSLKPLARQLRKQPTKAEKRLWRQLRSKQIAGVQFYRQKPLQSYIVDFYCAAAKLVIEVDGDSHFNDEQIQYDSDRTKKLEDMGLRVLQFTNQEVLREMEGVLEVIEEAVLNSSC